MSKPHCYPAPPPPEILPWPCLFVTAHVPCSTLQSPLESLELAFCALLPEDLRFLAQSPHAVRLKKLDLSGNDLSGSQLEPFQVLLQAAAATLLHLELTECQLADTQLLATLPVLTR